MKRRRMLLMVGALLLVIGVLGFIKFMQIRAAIASGSAWAPPPEAVTTVVATQADWPATLSAIGSVTAVHGVTVSADLPGIVKAIDFTSGRPVRQGHVLVRLDTSQERAQLAAADAARDLAKVNADRAKALLDKQVIAQAEYDRLAAELKQADARVGEIQAMIARKTIRAPFGGNVGIRQVDLGQYLNAGDPVVTLQTLDPVYVDFSLPQQDVRELKVGAVVHVSVDSTVTLQTQAKISAINSVIDQGTRNVQVQATLRNPQGLLRPGMFVDVQVVLGTKTAVIALPASAVSYAPYGNSVFVVGEMKDPKGKAYKGVRQQFVKLGAGRGDQVAVLDGLKAGEEVVTSGVFKLRNGASVLVNNKTMPANNPAPKPEDS